MSMMVRTMLGVMCLGCVVLTSVSPTWSAMLFLSPVSQTVLLGDPVLVNVRISGLGDGVDVSVGAFDLGVTYDTSALMATGVTFGPYLGDGLDSLQSSDITSPGVIDLAELSFLLDLSGQPSNFTLATLLFETVAPGTSMLEFSRAVVSDGFGFDLAPSIEKATVTVMNPIPVPSAMVLMGTSLVSLVGWRWWIKRSI